jgi:hypothetical protein
MEAAAAGKCNKMQVHVLKDKLGVLATRNNRSMLGET